MSPQELQAAVQRLTGPCQLRVIFDDFSGVVVWLMSVPGHEGSTLVAVSMMAAFATPALAADAYWTINAREDDGHGHGTQKPAGAHTRRAPLNNNSSPGQAIYEPFSGSGTTIVAAEMTGRSCFAIELDPAYVDVALKRWQAFTGKDARLEQSGLSFDEVAAERQLESAA